MMTKKSQRTLRCAMGALAAAVALVGVVGVEDLRALAGDYLPGGTAPAVEVSADPAMTLEELESYIAILEALPVKGRAPMTGYSRDQFGPAWTDDVDVAGGHNSCDTRNDILGAQLTELTFKAGTRDCVVLSGVLEDPYTGKTINFVRGQDTSSAVQVDHVVAMAAAWRTGAQQLSARERQNLANDPRNLIASDGPANQQKSDSDAASWLPDKRFRCRYISMQVDVKNAYSLWVTPPELEAMERVLSACVAAAAG